jgi:NAD-dependent SIR2 family protein deacetylase
MSFPANELWGNRFPVCPYCSHNQDRDDLHSYDGDIDELECEKCQKKFYYQTIISIEYSTVGDCKANGELPHTLKQKFPVSIKHFSCTKCQSEYYDWQLAEGPSQRLTKDEYTIVSTLNPKDEI